MRNRFLAAVAAASCCLGGVGCQSVMQCGDDCGRGASMAFQKYDCSCDGVCGECCGSTGCGSTAACTGGCGDGCTEGRCGVVNGLRNCLGCTGCGELYWSEWHNDPPSSCEPCDCLGNYTGPGGAGYYRAPYRRHDGLVESRPAAVRPLELADQSDEIVR